LKIRGTKILLEEVNVKRTGSVGAIITDSKLGGRMPPSRSRPQKQGSMLSISLCFALLGLASSQNEAVDFWNVDRPNDMANIASLEVMCGKTHMEVQISFDRRFNGIIFSKGAVDQYNCIYVKPQTGATSYSFKIMYDQCGTKPDLNGKFYENNIVIQYDKDLIEVWDEAKRLRCEWYNDYEKGITKPPIRVSDLEVVELNFRGDNVDCWMEIQHGKGPWANPVTGIVPLGTTLTMVIGINDKQGEFDMRVKSCSANAENSRSIQLSDEHGCVLRPKMISKYMKIAGADTRATVVTYAFFHAFKFPDSMAVHIKCKVEICRYGCPDHCQKPNSYQAREQEVSSSINVPQYRPGPRFEKHKAPTSNIKRKDVESELNNEISDISPVYPNPLPPQRLIQESPKSEKLPVPQRFVQEPAKRVPNQVVSNNQNPYQQYQKKQETLYQPKSAEFIQNRNAPHNLKQQPFNQNANVQIPETDKQSNIFPFNLKLPKIPPLFPWSQAENNAKENSPHPSGESIPISLGVRPNPGEVPIHHSKNKGGRGPQVYPSSFNPNQPVSPNDDLESIVSAKEFPQGPRGLKFDRRRKKRGLSEEMGVTSGYQVISEVDLAFKPNFEDGMGVTVFQGRIMPEEIVYGVCLPATGFSALFVLVALLTVISVLVSGFVCYHRQIQKAVEEGAPAAHPPPQTVSQVSLQRDWGISTLLRMPKL